MDDTKGRLADELLAYSALSGQLRRALREKLLLVYGSKSMLSIDLVIHTHRVTAFQGIVNTQALQEALNLLPMVIRAAYTREEIVKTWC